MKRREEITDEIGFWLSNLSSESMNLPFVVWIAVRLLSKEGPPQLIVTRKMTHDPSRGVWVAFEPGVRIIEGKLREAEFSSLKRWIELNKEILLKHWNLEISSDALLHGIRPL